MNTKCKYKTMNKGNLLWLLCFLIGTATVHAQGVNFETSTWEEVLAKAKEDNKPIFVDAYTVWCGPCKWMAKNVFVDEELGSAMNSQFISYKMNMESKEGVAFNKKYKVNVYPTLLYISADGELLHKGTGARDVAELVALNEEALNPSRQMAGFHRKYQAGEKSNEFLKSYLKVLQDAYEIEQMEEVFATYWNQLSMEEKITVENLELMGALTNWFEDFVNPYTQFLLKNKEAYQKVLSKDVYNEYESTAKTNSVYGIATIKDKGERNALLKMLLTYFPKDKKEIKTYMNYLLAQQTASSEVIEKKRKKYLKYCKNWQTLNGAAWTAFEQEEDTKELKRAVDWVNSSIAIDENFYNLDTKANLLYKLKDYSAAKQFAEAAKEVAKEEREIEAVNQLLEKIETAMK